MGGSPVQLHGRTSKEELRQFKIQDLLAVHSNTIGWIALRRMFQHSHGNKHKEIQNKKNLALKHKAKISISISFH